MRPAESSAAPDVAYHLRQSAITHQLDVIRRRYEEDGAEMLFLADYDVAGRLLAIQDQLAGHLRSRARELVRDDAELLGAFALLLLLSTAPEVRP